MFMFNRRVDGETIKNIFYSTYVAVYLTKIQLKWKKLSTYTCYLFTLSVVKKDILKFKIINLNHNNLIIVRTYIKKSSNKYICLQ